MFMKHRISLPVSLSARPFGVALPCPRPAFGPGKRVQYRKGGPNSCLWQRNVSLAARLRILSEYGRSDWACSVMDPMLFVPERLSGQPANASGFYIAAV